MGKRRLTDRQQRRIETGSGDADLPIGRVVARYGKRADVLAPGQNIYSCHIRANLNALAERQAYQFNADQQVASGVVCGDQVKFCAPTEGTDGAIDSILPRDTVLLRPDSRGKLRPVAANISTICIVIAPVPEPHNNLIDRYIVASENQYMTPVLVCNKTDLLSSQDLSAFQQRFDLYRQLGYEVFMVSAHDPETLTGLKQLLARKTSIFVGQSGVGKSSLLHTLIPDFDDDIGALSEAKSGKVKGRHTTTTSRLYHLTDGGSVIDSPGIREFGLWHLQQEQIQQGFVEIALAAQGCRFRDCKHQTEPGCAVMEAVKNLDIAPERFESYRYIVDSLGQDY